MRTSFVLCCLLLLPSFYGNAQQKNSLFLIDSLKKELFNARTDTSRIKILNRISFIYSEFNYDEGHRYAAEAELLSVRINWKRGIANANTALALNYTGKCIYQKAIYHYTKSLETYREIDDKRG